jgi:hypothetical protein
MARETFLAAMHLTYQNHFEDTPREAARVHTLAASLLLGARFPQLNIFLSFQNLEEPEFEGKLFSAASSSGNSGKTL